MYVTHRFRGQGGFSPVTHGTSYQFGGIDGFLPSSLQVALPDLKQSVHPLDLHRHGRDLVARGERRSILEQGGPQEPEHDSEMPETSVTPAKSSAKRPTRQKPRKTSVSDPTHPTTQRKPRDPDFYRTIGKRGGEATRDRHPDHFKNIAPKGGRKNVDAHDSEHFSDIGQRGGEKTRERYGSQFFREIGKKGGSQPRHNKS